MHRFRSAVLHSQSRTVYRQRARHPQRGPAPRRADVGNRHHRLPAWHQHRVGADQRQRDNRRTGLGELFGHDVPGRIHVRRPAGSSTSTSTKSRTSQLAGRRAQRTELPRRVARSRGRPRAGHRHAVGSTTAFTFNTFQYTGQHGLAAYQAEFDPAATSCPVENAGNAGTPNAHWDQLMRSSPQEGRRRRRPVLLDPRVGVTDQYGRDRGLELMTGAIDPDYREPFVAASRVESMRDLGYAVAAFEDFNGDGAVDCADLAILHGQHRRDGPADRQHARSATPTATAASTSLTCTRGKPRRGVRSRGRWRWRIVAILGACRSAPHRAI